MSRRRYISTDISSDGRVNRLASEAGAFAVLLYTWMIPHATDDGGITSDLDELRLLVVPGVKASKPMMEKAVSAMETLGLLEREGSRLFFPPDPFYKYQNYIKSENRRTMPQNPTEPHGIPQNPVSLSPSLSPSPPVSPSPSPPLSLSGREDRAGAALRPDLEIEPDERPFALEYIRRVEQREAKPPSPIDKAAARQLERDFGTEKCREVAADFDWVKNPQYLRKVLEGRANGNTNGANSGKPAAATYPGGVAGGVSDLERLRAAVAARGQQG